MRNEEAITFLENSFLSELLKIEGITDISYNGKSIFFQTNSKGRMKSSLQIDNEVVGAFLKQIANLMECSFSYSKPVLDVSFGRYRLNGVNRSLARYKNEKCYTFAIRLASSTPRLDSDFFKEEDLKIIHELLEKKESIVIGGLTSSGKTELQKYLLMHMTPSCRVIVIDNLEELDLVENENIDMSTWLTDSNIPGASFSGLIKNSLRNNPDYVIVAECRGGETLDALTSAMSGHPIITTIHARDLEGMPDRMARLSMMGNERLYKEEVLDDLSHHIHYYVYVEKKVEKDSSIKRRIASIGELEDGQKKVKVIYRRKD